MSSHRKCRFDAWTVGSRRRGGLSTREADRAQRIRGAGDPFPTRGADGAKRIGGAGDLFPIRRYPGVPLHLREQPYNRSVRAAVLVVAITCFGTGTFAEDAIQFATHARSIRQGEVVVFTATTSQPVDAMRARAFDRD